MFLVYGVAVIGLIIWAAQTTKQKVLPALLLVAAVVLALLGWITVRQPSEQPDYRGRVTVVSPDDNPVDDAHVRSNLGGEAKKVEGGWEIDLPSESAKGHKLTAYAEVQNRGWSGNADLDFGDDHSPPLKVFLKETGELPVRGTVLDVTGRSVPNAQITVIGFGEEGVSTGSREGAGERASATRATPTGASSERYRHATRARATAAGVGNWPSVLMTMIG